MIPNSFFSSSLNLLLLVEAMVNGEKRVWDCGGKDFCQVVIQTNLQILVCGCLYLDSVEEMAIEKDS